MTKKLYDLDSHRRDFTAAVLRCDADGERYAVVLDQTLFFPEGGGQGADHGTLDGVQVLDAHDVRGEVEHLVSAPLTIGSEVRGHVDAARRLDMMQQHTGVLGGARVLDVQITQEAIVHYTDAPLTPGAQVRGEIDWPQRFRRMQGHSGEHIISGLIHSEYGLDNVGFHLGQDTITMDYNGELTWPQLMHIEQLANEAVYRNVPIRTEYPSAERLAQMTYRSKLDLTEDVRIVTVEGYDVCACCAPHVSCTGEIGAIKFTSVMRHRGGIRVTILCGADAEVDYREKSAQVAALSAQLSVRQADVVSAVQRLLDEIVQLKTAAAELEHRLNAQRLQLLHETPGSICVIDRFDDPVAMREFVNAGMLLAGGVCAAFTGSDAEGYRYIIGSRTLDLRAEAKTINAAISGRGGGKPTMIQGSCTAPADAIKAFFAAYPGK